MASVSTMLLYAIAQAGVNSTLIAAGDPKIECNSHLQARFGLAPHKMFCVKLARRTLFADVTCTPLFYLRACRFILRSRRRREMTIVISRNTTFLPWLLLLKLFFGCRVLFESHAFHGNASLPGVPQMGKRKMFCLSTQYRMIERLFLNVCDGLLCQSALQRDLYAKDFVRIPTAVVPLGSQTYCGNSLGEPDGNMAIRKRIAYIGNYFGSIDTDIILDALAMSLGRGISFLWIGLQDSEKTPFLEKAKIKGVAELCDVRGWMPHREMIDLLRKEAGVGIVIYKPSLLTSAVVSPTKIFDYYAAGLPVIGPDFPSVTEHVRDGEEGALYTAGDPQSLARAIVAVLSDELHYRKLKSNALLAAQRCSWDNRAKRFIAFAAALPGTAPAKFRLIRNQ